MPTKCTTRNVLTKSRTSGSVPRTALYHPIRPLSSERRVGTGLVARSLHLRAPNVWGLTLMSLMSAQERALWAISIAITFSREPEPEVGAEVESESDISSTQSYYPSLPDDSSSSEANANWHRLVSLRWMPMSNSIPNSMTIGGERGTKDLGTYSDAADCPFLLSHPRRVLECEE